VDIHVTTRHCTLTDLEHQSAVHMAEHFGKYNSEIVRVDAIIEDSSHTMSCEFTVKIPGHLIVSKESASDFGKAIHDAGQKISHQLMKIHEKHVKDRGR